MGRHHASAPAGSRPRRPVMLRLLRIAGGMLALTLTVTLAVGVAYALTNLEELKAKVPRLDGRQVKSPIEQSADDAVDYAHEVTRPRESDGNGPGFVLSARPPAGIDAPPGHWCPAQVIGYRIDPTAAVAAGSTVRRERQRWRAAFAEWTQASGGRYRFAYRGLAHYPVNPDPGTFPIDPASVPKGEVGISYAFAPADDGKLSKYVHPSMSSALGVGGVGPIDWQSGAGQALITRGMVVLDAQDSADDPHAVPTPYIHEAGHALGLGHVDDSGQMMAPDAGSSSVINDGDRAGIARLLRLGCT